MTETPREDAAVTQPESTAVEPTGNERIDEALSRLEDLDEVDINDHPEQFDAIHQALRESLASAGRDEGSLESP